MKLKLKIFFFVWFIFNTYFIQHTRKDMNNTIKKDKYKISHTDHRQLAVWRWEKVNKKENVFWIFSVLLDDLIPALMSSHIVQSYDAWTACHRTDSNRVAVHYGVYITKRKFNVLIAQTFVADIKLELTFDVEQGLPDWPVSFYRQSTQMPWSHCVNASATSEWIWDGRICNRLRTVKRKGCWWRMSAFNH